MPLEGPAAATAKCPVACVILAAGRSQRFGRSDKLNAVIEGETILRRTAVAACQSQCSQVIVVTQPRATALHRALSGLAVRFIENPDHLKGMSQSIKAGIAALPQSAAGAMILPGDMPWLTAGILDMLIDTFRRDAGQRVIVPVNAAGLQANPLIWPSVWFPQLMGISGDRGAKSLIPKDKSQRLEVVFSDEFAFRDVDEPGDLLERGDP